MYDTFHPFNFPYATTNFKEWAPRKLKEVFRIEPEVIKDDIIYKDIYLNGGNVLILGGGPSSQAKLDLSRYTDIWSMNKCFNLNIKFDLIGVGAGVDIENKKFKDYCELFKPQLAFEIHPNWINKQVPATGYFHTKMYGKIGVGVRLVNLAAAVGATHIDFIGFDGPSAILNGAHYFEPGKTDLPSFCTKDNADAVHLTQYNFFWNYIRDLYPKVNFNSLDKKNKYHKCLDQNVK